MAIDTIVFDFGAVLIDWNPRHLYRKVFSDEHDMEMFLKEICTDEWNAEQDRGRKLAVGTELLIEKFPAKSDLIRMYYERWTEMLKGPIEGSVSILKTLKPHYKVYGLTNWSIETFPMALERYDFLQLFDGIVVSGEERMIKPDPEIFQLLMKRHKVVPVNTVFIDDNIRNVMAAQKLQFNTVHFKSPAQLRDELIAMGIPEAAAVP